MRRIAAILVLFVLAQPDGASASVIEGHGWGWSSRHAPALAAGDTVTGLFRADNLDPVLGIDLQAEEVSGRIAGIVKQVEDLGGGYCRCSLVQATLEIYEDPTIDSDYGANPPNPTAPATFTNGTPCLVGTLRDFYIYLSSATLSGGFECGLDRMTGHCADTLYDYMGLWACGVGAALELDESGPIGYDFRFDFEMGIAMVPIIWGLPCFHVAEAHFDFGSAPCPLPTGSRGDFRIRGEFVMDEDEQTFDPAEQSFSVNIGSLGQRLPRGSLVEQPTAPEPTWSYSNPPGQAFLSSVTLIRGAGRLWAFELVGHGSARHSLLADDGSVQIRLSPAPWCEGWECVITGGACATPSYTAPDQHPCAQARLAADGPADGVTAGGWVLRAPHPNPFTARTAFRVRATESATAKIAIYDVRGSLLRTLHDGSVSAGEHVFFWDGRDGNRRPVATGVYFCRLRTPFGSAMQKVILDR